MSVQRSRRNASIHYRPPSGIAGILSGWDVWVDAKSGLVNKGTDQGVTVALGGSATDEGTYWDIPDASSGVVVSGLAMSGDFATVPGFTNPAREFFIVVDLGALSGSSGLRRIAALQKTGTGATNRGLQLAHTGTTTFTPQTSQGDGAGGSSDTPVDADIAGEGVSIVWGGTSWYLADLLVQRTITPAGDQGQANVADSTAKPFTTTGTALVLGAGTSTVAGTPSGGINGTRDFKVLAGGCRLRPTTQPAMTAAQMASIRAYYSSH